MTTQVLEPVSASPAPTIETTAYAEPSTPPVIVRLPRHLPALDGVRGLALLMVMVLHFTYSVDYSTVLGRTVLSICHAGWLGVDLFFVLSGFLITGILLDTKEDPHRVRNFYARRSLRIFPLYYGFLAAYFLIGPKFGFQRERIAEAAQYQGWLWTYCTNILICLKGEFIVPSVNHFWSLAVEEHFYLVWPAIVWLCSPRALTRVCIGAMILAVASRFIFTFTHVWTEAPYVLTICRVDTLAMGGLLAIGARSAGGLRQFTKPAIVALAVFAAYVIAFILPRQDFPAGANLATVFTVSAFGFGGLMILVLNAADDSRLNRAFRWTPLRKLGFYSYGLYVFHHPIRLAMEHILPYERVVAKVHVYALGVLLHMLLCFAISLAVALVSYHLYEKQFLKLKRYFEARPRVITPRIPVP